MTTETTEERIERLGLLNVWFENGDKTKAFRTIDEVDFQFIVEQLRIKRALSKVDDLQTAALDEMTIQSEIERMSNKEKLAYLQADIRRANNFIFPDDSVQHCTIKLETFNWLVSLAAVADAREDEVASLQEEVDYLNASLDNYR